jgi:hypothetical protein
LTLSLLSLEVMVAEKFTYTDKTLMCVDESTIIKNMAQLKEQRDVLRLERMPSIESS